jgi:hypothetical protein
MFKNIITLINTDWCIIDTLRVSVIPRNGELIYLKSSNQYKEVVNVVHFFDKKQGVFIVVADYSGPVGVLNK